MLIIMNKEILEKIGLNKGEIAVYLSIIENKNIGPAELSKQTKIKRTTVYSVVKALMSRGLVVEDLGSGKKHFVPASAGELGQILKKEEVDFKNKEKLIKKIIEELENSSIGKQYNPPKIRFIEEENISSYMHSRNAEWDRSLLKYDKCWWGFQDHTFVENYKRWIDSFWKQASRDTNLNLLTNESEIEKEMFGKYPNRKMKYWKKSNFTATTWVVGDYLIIIETNKHPFYLLEINDPVLTHNMRELFKNIWEIA